MLTCSQHARREACALCLVFYLLLHAHPHMCSSTPPPGGAVTGAGYVHLSPPGTHAHHSRVFIKSIFDKYGEDGLLTFEGFQRLLSSLALGGHQGHVAYENLRPSDPALTTSPPDGGKDTSQVTTSYLERPRPGQQQQQPPADDQASPAQGSGGSSRQGASTPHTEAASPDAIHTQGYFRSRRLSAASLSQGAAPGEAPRGSHHHPLRHRRQRRSDSTDDHERAPDVERGVSTDECMSADQLLKVLSIPPGQPLREADFLELCPALVQQLDSRACGAPGTGRGDPAHHPLHSAHEHAHEEHEEEEGSHHNHSHHDHHEDSHPNQGSSPARMSVEVWGYAFLSVLVISLVGLLSVAIVPIMHKVFYNHLLQFLVALAVGSLTGDAFLHLIPHALNQHSSHGAHGADGVGGHGGGHGEGQEDEGAEQHMMSIWRGMVMLAGIYFFFLIERLMCIITSWRHRVHKKTRRLSSPKLYRTVEEHESEVGAKLSKHSDVVTSCEEIVMVVHPGKDVRNMAEDMHEELHRDCEPEDRLQLNHSHGHNHAHGTLPTTVASMAWMVIMGDGLHNFTDGLAIGAAFSSGLSSGLSTSVAVFCHELPHEIGDFAVLLRAGMTVRQAIVYNCVSSLLCLFGMVVGVCVGNLSSVSLWVFALAGGMFVYIALVDMLPELTAVQPKKGENPLVHLMLQNAGMLTGAAIMLVIAIYEENIAFPHFEP